MNYKDDDILTQSKHTINQNFYHDRVVFKDEPHSYLYSVKKKGKKVNFVKKDHIFSKGHYGNMVDLQTDVLGI